MSEDRERIFEKTEEDSENDVDAHRLDQRVFENTESGEESDDVEAHRLDQRVSQKADLGDAEDDVEAHKFL